MVSRPRNHVANLEPAVFVRGLLEVNRAHRNDIAASSSIASALFSGRHPPSARKGDVRDALGIVVNEAELGVSQRHPRSLHEPPDDRAAW